MSVFPLWLTIRPACGLPGEFVCPTNSKELLQILRNKTELPTSVLERFFGELRVHSSVRLLGVDLSDSHLTRIGYFVD